MKGNDKSKKNVKKIEIFWKKLGSKIIFMNSIDHDKIFIKVEGYDNNGMWIYHPGFLAPNLKDENNEKTKKNSSININPLGFHRFHSSFSRRRRL